VGSGKVVAAAEDMLATESKLGDGNKYEFPNRTASSAAQAVCDAFRALSSANQADLAQPDNWEFILRTGCKFLSYQVVAFREYLKVRETQNALVMKLTANLDKHLENQRNGKPVKSGSIFGAKVSEEEIIAAAKAELETETTQLNFMTSALEFSEVGLPQFGVNSLCVCFTLPICACSYLKLSVKDVASSLLVAYESSFVSLLSYLSYLSVLQPDCENKGRPFPLRPLRFRA